MEISDAEHRLREHAATAASAEECELIDLEIRRQARRSVIELTIDHSGGVTVDQCAQVSRRLSAALEAAGEEPIAGAWVLEVGSPGLTRKLKKPDDYRRFRGRLARLELRSPVAGRRRLRGTICDVGDDDTVHLQADPEATPVAVAWEVIARGRLDFEPDGGAQKPKRTRDAGAGGGS